MLTTFDYPLKNPINKSIGDSSLKIKALRFNAPRGIHIPLVKQLVEIMKKAQLDISQKLKDSESVESNAPPQEDNIKIKENEFLDLLAMTGNYSEYIRIFKSLVLSDEVCFKNTNDPLKEFDFDRFYFKDIESMMAEYYINFLG